MSIPSINFRRSPQRSPASQRVITRKSPGPRSPAPRSPTKVQIDFSSSVSDSDDIPMLSSKKKPVTTTAILESDTSSEEPKEEEEPKQKEESEPEEIPAPPPKRTTPVRKMPQRQTRPKPKPQENVNAEYSYSYSYSDEVGVAKPVTPPRSPKSSPKSSPKESPKQVEEEPVPAKEEVVEEPPEPVDETMKEFSLAKDTSSKKHTCFRLLRGEKVVFFSKLGKDGIGKYQVISTTEQLDMEIQTGYVGLVRFRGGGKRFSIATSETKPNDDREAHIAGGAIYQKKHEKVRSCKVVLTANGKPAWPISARHDLDSIAAAASKDEDIGEKYRIFDSRKGWELRREEESEFGDIVFMKSCKNFIIENQDKEIIFMLYKKADGWFGVKCRYPITPFIAFGIGMAIIASK